MNRINFFGSQLSGQPMFQVLDKVQKLERLGKKIYHFELGEPNFDTPKNIAQRAVKAILDGDTHYSNSFGKYNLREAIAKTTLSSRGFEPDINQILVTPGANSIIFMLFSIILEEGDEIIIPDPGFPTYLSVANLFKIKIKKIPIREENNFGLDFDELEKLVSKKTKLIVLNSPSNPTGGIISSDTLKKIAHLCHQKKIYLLTDEIYSRMRYYSDEYKFYSPSLYDKCKENTIIINGFSKAFAMTGWRVGVAIGPEEIIKKMGLFLETTVSCVPPFIQEAAYEAITGDQSEQLAMMTEYKKRRDLLVSGLNSFKSISCNNPMGAIYAFANIKKTNLSSDQFVSKALNECGVAALPGNNFGERGEGYVRFSFVRSIDEINEALSLLKNIFE